MPTLRIHKSQIKPFTEWLDSCGAKLTTHKHDAYEVLRYTTLSGRYIVNSRSRGRFTCNHTDVQEHVGQFHRKEVLRFDKPTTGCMVEMPECYRHEVTDLKTQFNSEVAPKRSIIRVWVFTSGVMLGLILCKLALNAGWF